MHRIAALVALAAAPALAAEPPRLRSAMPDHGDSGVSPALTELRIEFDQDMDTGGRSICGGGESFPKITGTPRWQSPRILIIPVQLAPDHRYRLSINCPAARNFRSAAGEIAEITPLTFTTGSAGAAVQPSAPLTPDQNSSALTALRRAIDTCYSHRDGVVTDWDALFSRARPEILAATTRAAFARSAARMLAATQDLHFSIGVGEARFPTYRQEVNPNIDLSRIPKLVPNFTRHNDTVSTGRFDDGIGYILINGWPGDATSLKPAFDALASWTAAPAIIIDVRANGGGDEPAASRFASRFVSTPTVYSRDRIRDPDAPEGWTSTFDRTVPAADPGPALGTPVAVLMGPVCVSSCESFLLMMRHGAQATLIGQASGGSSGRPMPIDLGNGVAAFVPSWEDSHPDGMPIEHRGIAPDVSVSPLPGAAGDATLDAALAHLRTHPR